tara:strand:- start:29413 stop:30405 length:993 start_codon:yes stop_codon:yes gene_type:complete
MQSRTILVTGGAGFIGSHLVKLLVNKYPQYDVHVLDSLTYAGNLHNLEEVMDQITFHKYDISEIRFIEKLFQLHPFDGIFHLAAETHVDNSIKNPNVFVNTNVMGTLNLINLALEYSCRFLQVSTDEVYGSLNLDEETHFYEFTCYNPNSPYAASKAAADLLILSYFNTYNLNCNITNCSNNFGTHQHDEKLIPTIVKCLTQNKPIPIYGDGLNVRDWLAVDDHVNALDLIFHNGKAGEKYNIGTHNEISNIDLVKLICRMYDSIKNKEGGDSNRLLSFVDDREGHDRRYAINADKIKNKLRWKPTKVFSEELLKTVKFYIKKYESNDSI